MKRMVKWSVVVLCVQWFFSPNANSQDTAQVKGPVEYTYRTVDGKSLSAFVFHPAKAIAGRAAIVLFHGGGWAVGEPEWAFGRARHFAGCGLVAIAAQYRLSDQKTVTLVEAMADARAVVQWTRSSAGTLGVDPDRIVAYGWSAGGHLAACTAIFADTTAEGSVSSSPNALILVSPALELEKDSWARQLLGNRGDISSISPVSHIRGGLPPTLILQGSDDTVTPLTGAQLFTKRMEAKGNQCALQVYPNVGHLFTPLGVRDDTWPQPDLKVQAMAFQKADEFLKTLDLMK